MGWKYKREKVYYTLRPITIRVPMFIWNIKWWLIKRRRKKAQKITDAIDEKHLTAYEGEKCVWTRCDDDWANELWSTSCGQEFNLKDGYTPADNGMKYCCFCGKSLGEGE